MQVRPHLEPCVQIRALQLKRGVGKLVRAQRRVTWTVRGMEAVHALGGQVEGVGRAWFGEEMATGCRSRFRISGVGGLSGGRCSGFAL